MSTLPVSFRYLSAEAFAQDSERMSSLDGLQSTLSSLDDLLGDLLRVVPTPLAPAVETLQKDIDAFRPRVAIVGQVKAGKTALVNALLGMPDFLPSDVNPWTSAVTSVHLNKPPADGNQAVFRFFDEETWARIANHGGRLGELAARSDAEDEGDLLRTQVSDLRRRTAKRLGRNYHLLLGRSHRFAEVTPDLVRRYVCLGDEGETDPGREGRFADLTQSAELYLAAPEYSISLTMEDTPGVNDPFLVREQMTLDSLDQASICVLVLSAYQAMTTVDMALVRLLRTLKSEQVVIFVNRIDELPDRDRNVQKIETMLRAVLAEQGTIQNAKIVFGSADWARKAALGSMDQLTETDMEALSETLGVSDGGLERRTALNALRGMSGLVELKGAIADMVSSGMGVRKTAEFRRRAKDLIEQAKVHLSDIDGAASSADEFEIADRLDVIAETAELGFSVAMQSAVGAVEGLHGSTVSRWIERTAPTAAQSEDGIVDPSELRPALVSAYREIAAEARGSIDVIMADVEASLREVYKLLLPTGSDVFPIYRCEAPEFPRPTALARSTSFDLRGGWKDIVRSARARAEQREERFREMANREFGDILAEVGRDAIGEGFAESSRALHGFLMPHVLNIQALAAADGTEDRRQALLDGHAARLLQQIEDLSTRIGEIDPRVRVAKAVGE